MEGISCGPIWKAVSAIGWSIFTVQSAVCPLHASKIFEPLSTVEWDDFRLFANFDNFGPKRHARRVRNSYCCCCCCCCCCWLTCSVWLLWWEGWWVGRPVELSQLSGGRRNLYLPHWGWNTEANVVLYLQWAPRWNRLWEFGTHRLVLLINICK